MELLESLIARIPRWGAEILINMGLPVPWDAELSYDGKRVVIKHYSVSGSFDKKGNFFIGNRRVTPRFFKNFWVLRNQYTVDIINRINDLFPLDEVRVVDGRAPKITYGNWTIENIDNIEFGMLAPFDFEFSFKKGIKIPKNVHVITSSNVETIIIKKHNFSIRSSGYIYEDYANADPPEFLYRGARWDVSSDGDDNVIDSFVDDMASTDKRAVETGMELLNSIRAEKIGGFTVYSSVFVDKSLFVSKNAVIAADDYDSARKMYSNADKELLLDGWLFVKNKEETYYRKRFGTLRAIIRGDSKKARIKLLNGKEVTVPYTDLFYMKSMYDVFRALVFF